MFRSTMWPLLVDVASSGSGVAAWQNLALALQAGSEAGLLNPKP